MKQYRLDFAKGINVVSDKATLQPGWVTVADGVDLRSGQIRNFKGHVFYADANSTATCLFVFRDYPYLSDEWRDYFTESVNSQDRLYYSRYGMSPQKMIDGEAVDLGIETPSIAPIASNLKGNGLTLSLEQFTEGGIFSTGTYRSYRVAAKTENGVQVPCYAQIVTFTNPSTIQTHSVRLTWTAVKDALGYVIFAGSSGNEKLALEVGDAVLSAIDDGSWPAGEDVRNYDDNRLYTYCYTFERDFKGQIDESGPSPVSQPIKTTYGRQLLFNARSDGFFSQSNLVSLTGPFTVVTTGSAPTSAISAVSVNTSMKKTLFTIATGINARVGDTVVFVKDSVPSDRYLISGMTDSTHLIVDGDLTWLTTSYTVKQIKTFAEWTPGGSETHIADNDVVLVTSTTTGGTQVGTYRARTETPATGGNLKISFPYESQAGINFTITSIKFVPGNGYIKYRCLYRTAPAGGWGLVEKIPIWQTDYTDTVSAQNLGDAPKSYYIENGVQVINAKPPVGLVGLTAHYGMAFGIDGIRVRWTPKGVYDAWPEAFYQEFPSRPVGLASFAGALIVLCEDAIFRLDGTQPTALAINGTKAHDGCIAPHSIQISSDAGLLYLSRRGIMAFDGMNAVCLSDHAIPARFWQAPSYLTDVTAFCLLPTLTSHNYAALAYEDGIRGYFTNGYSQHLNNPLPGVINDLQSFVWNGKYFLAWTNHSGNYGEHTVLCLDLKREGRPITTLPYRFRAVCASETGRAFGILRDSSTGRTTVTITHEAQP